MLLYLLEFEKEGTIVFSACVSSSERQMTEPKICIDNTALYNFLTWKAKCFNCKALWGLIPYAWRKKIPAFLLSTDSQIWQVKGDTKHIGPLAKASRFCDKT